MGTGREKNLRISRRTRRSLRLNAFILIRVHPRKSAANEVGER